MTSAVLAGLLLGWAHWRMFLWNVTALLPQDRVHRMRILAVLGTGLRLTLTAGTGFILVAFGKVNPQGLVLGVILSVIIFRFWALYQAREGKAE